MKETQATSAAAVGVEEFNWMRQGRAPIACQQCRIQRIRCDVVLQKGSCTNCVFYELECEVVTGKRRARALDQLVTIPANEICLVRPVDSAGDDEDGQAAAGNNNSAISHARLPLTEKPDNISDEEFVLLRNKGTFEMLSTDLRHAMIQVYLRHVYSHMPIISFQDLVFMADPGRRYSNWFVFMALCAISVNFIDKTLLQQLGVSSPEEASQMFFAKAETLYRFQWQGHHKYTTIQGLLLLAFCEKEVYEKSGWSWTWLAYTTTIELGLDRKPVKTNLRDLGLRRRLWWTCYNQCCLLNLHSKTAPRISIADTSVPPPTQRDFEPHKPIFCLDLIPALTTAQGSCAAFIDRVQLLRMYNECTFRQQVTRDFGITPSDVLIDLKDIFRSATRTDFNHLVGAKSITQEKALCPISSSPLDIGLDYHLQEPTGLGSGTVSNLLDMERILYNCPSNSDTDMDMTEQGRVL
ncbi:hypothetical protein BJY01DRAFT_241849 [Aspergillus pseudoustus]|uniref:Zn(2)-C6 fungal-type domain-containing protein n=1 Tax=Aspergillus pseudoustus TaxID=1810923 RepID=A0ABR4L1V5_9EURO